MEPSIFIPGLISFTIAFPAGLRAGKNGGFRFGAVTALTLTVLAVGGSFRFDIHSGLMYVWQR